MTVAGGGGDGVVVLVVVVVIDLERSLSTVILDIRETKISTGATNASPLNSLLKHTKY